MARKMPFPIVVTEGFGQKPMSEATYRLLSTNLKRDVNLNAESFDPEKGTRPEIVIPLPGADELRVAKKIANLESGQRVRITRARIRVQLPTWMQSYPDTPCFRTDCERQLPVSRLKTGKRPLFRWRI